MQTYIRRHALLARHDGFIRAFGPHRLPSVCRQETLQVFRKLVRPFFHRLFSIGLRRKVCNKSKIS